MNWGKKKVLSNQEDKNSLHMAIVGAVKCLFRSIFQRVAAIIWAYIQWKNHTTHSNKINDLGEGFGEDSDGVSR